MKKKTRSINSDKPCKISALEKRVSELEKKFDDLAQFTLVSCPESDRLDKCDICHINLKDTRGYSCGIDNCPSKATITQSTSIKSTIFSWRPYPKS